MAARICQSIPWHSCVARTWSGEKHFQALQGKEPLIIVKDLLLKSWFKKCDWRLLELIYISSVSDIYYKEFDTQTYKYFTHISDRVSFHVWSVKSTFFIEPKTSWYLRRPSLEDCCPKCKLTLHLYHQRWQKHIVVVTCKLWNTIQETNTNLHSLRKTI